MGRRWFAEQLNMKKLALIVLSAALVASCYYDNKEDLYQNFPKGDCDTTAVTYSAFIQPLLAQKCATSGCHLPPSISAGLDLSQYASAKAIADNGSFYNRIRGIGPLMPQGGPALSPCEIDKIKSWIDAGALEN
jgi:hypothetical protein